MPISCFRYVLVLAISSFPIHPQQFNFYTTILLSLALLQSQLSTSQSNPDEWWTTSCGVAEKHEIRAPGQSYPSSSGLYPWQVAIFIIPRTAVETLESVKSKVVPTAPYLDFICVGTIITRSIILTAASCLFSENIKKPIRPEMLRVVAGKQRLSLKVEKDAQKREVQIVKLIDTYEGEITLQADNIAILVTKRPFEFNKYIQPACVDVNSELTQYQLARAFVNKTIEGAAFGLSKPIESSDEVLREAVFRFQTHSECQSTKESSIQGFLLHDRFCIDTPEGRIPEDTGMGLVMLVEDKYYLQGILSENIKQEFSVVTNISEHSAWLKEAVKKVMDKAQCKHMFKCGNLACISPSQKCDGYDDCGDGSDELDCSNQPFSGVMRTNCELPPLLIDGVFHCIDEDCTLEGGEEVGFGKSVNLSCGLGSAVPDTNPLGTYACLSTGKWSPEEPKCIRECEPLVKPHVNSTCKYKNQKADCKGYMRPGTVATFRCDTHYKPLVATLSARETKCLPGGRWRNELPECIPDCGSINPLASKATTTVAFGVDTKNVLEYPWQVALHNKTATLEDPGFKWIQHCGGTLISSHLVLTAAHCLFMPNEFKRMKTENIMVTAGKYKRDFYDKEKAQQERAVKEVMVPSAYGGFDKRYSHDIAIMKLEKPFEMSSYVLPICLKLDRSFELSNTTGTVVGWGDTENGIPSPILLKAEIPLVTLEDCKRIMKKSKNKFIYFLTFDKFCGRFVNGSGPVMRDSGGGVIVQEGSKWYVIGVVTIKDFTNTTAALTNIYSLKDFIASTMKTFKKH